MSRDAVPEASRGLVEQIVELPQTGLGVALGDVVWASSRSTPSSRRISVRAARAVSPIADSRSAPAAGSPGVVNRAVSASHGDHRDVVGDDVVELA